MKLKSKLKVKFKPYPEPPFIRMCAECRIDLDTMLPVADSVPEEDITAGYCANCKTAWLKTMGETLKKLRINKEQETWKNLKK